MRLKNLFLFLPLLSLNASEDDFTQNTAISFWGEFLYMQRQVSNSESFITDSSTQVRNECSNCVSKTYCKQRNLIEKLNFEPGYRVGLHYQTRHTTLEATYLEIGAWRTECEKTSSAGTLFLNEDDTYLNDFSYANSAKVKYYSRFQDSELNFWWHPAARHQNYFEGAWVFGLTGQSITEHFTLAYTNSGETSHYRVGVKNRIFGLQSGGAIRWNMSNHWYWDLATKVGIGFDWASDKVLQGDDGDSEVIRDYKARQFSYPFLLHSSLVLGYRPFAAFAMSVGYELIYLTGVVLAPDQILKGQSSQKRIRADGDPLFQGVSGSLAFFF